MSPKRGCGWPANGGTRRGVLLNPNQRFSRTRLLHGSSNREMHKKVLEVINFDNASLLSASRSQRSLRFAIIQKSLAISESQDKGMLHTLRFKGTMEGR